MPACGSTCGVISASPVIRLDMLTRSLGHCCALWDMTGLLARIWHSRCTAQLHNMHRGPSCQAPNKRWGAPVETTEQDHEDDALHKRKNDEDPGAVPGGPEHAVQSLHSQVWISR